MLNIKNKIDPILALLCFGYLVDFFDLTVFAASRLSCLTSLGIEPSRYQEASVFIFNVQAIGVFVGGLTMGLWGDKIGRFSAIRYGILLFSTATFLNAFCTDLYSFAALRFLACIGLAGEFASCATIITEIYEGQKRSFASGLLYSSGVIGGLLCAIIAAYVPWKPLFIVGGLSGFLVLILRLRLLDPQFFNTLKKDTSIPKGNLFLIFFKPHTLKKVLLLLCMGIPFWFLAYIVNFSPELAKRLGIVEEVKSSTALIYFFLGGILGSLTFTKLSKVFKSRKRPLQLGFMMIPLIALLFLFTQTSLALYGVIFLLGIISGYPGLFVITVTEQFGSNQRVTATSLVTNGMRLCLILINVIMGSFLAYFSQVEVALLMGALTFFLIGVLPSLLIEETYDRKIDFIE
jgi:putative MFS transporter